MVLSNHLATTFTKSLRHRHPVPGDHPILVGGGAEVRLSKDGPEAGGDAKLATSKAKTQQPLEPPPQQVKTQEAPKQLMASSYIGEATGVPTVLGLIKVGPQTRT